MKKTQRLALQDRVQVAVGQPGAPRAQSVQVDGETFWIKQRQERGLLLRLRKGSSASLLDHERGSFEHLYARGLPVPEIVLTGESYFVTRDVGSRVDHLLKDQDASDDQKLNLLEKVVAAVLDLHANSAAHGGLHLRNICLNEDGISFIDLEKCQIQNASVSDKSYDLRVLVFSVFAVLPGDYRAAKHVLSLYQDSAPQDVVRHARDWCARHWWLTHLIAPLKWHEDHLRPDRLYRQYGAIGPALKVFGSPSD